MAVIYISAFLMIVLIFILITGSNENKKQWTVLNRQGVTKDDLIHVGTYVGGHPGINSSILNTVIYKSEKDLIIAEQHTLQAAPIRKSFISISSIKSVLVEDSGSIENHIILDSALLVSLFDGISYNKNTNEVAFLTIDWNDDKKEHSTIFLFEGKNAMDKATTVQSTIIKLLN